MWHGTAQVGWGIERPGLIGGIPTSDRGLEGEDLEAAFQPKPFYHPMSLAFPACKSFLPPYLQLQDDLSVFQCMLLEHPGL